MALLWQKQEADAQTSTDADDADGIALLANTPTQSESQLHSLEKAAGGIGLHVNADKMEYMCFNRNGGISTLKDGSLKLMDKFTYDTNTRQAKAWTAINRLSVIWRSDLSVKIKRNFVQVAVMSILLYGCTTWTLKKLDRNCTKMLQAVMNKSWK